MTDRKLPVILRPVYIGHIGGTIMASHFHPGGIASIDPTLETVKYEPAVPRCKTCEQWDPPVAKAPETWGICTRTCESEELDDYCSRHSELRKP